MKTKFTISVLLMVGIIISSIPITASSWAGSVDSETEFLVETYIRCAANGKYLSLANGTASEGKEVILQPKTDAYSQKWTVNRHGDDIYSIHFSNNEHYTICLQNGTNTENERYVVKYFSDIENLPDSALFNNFEIDIYHVAVLFSQLSYNNGGSKVAICSNDKLISKSFSNELNVLYQYFVYEDVDRSVKTQTWDLVEGGHLDWDSSSKYSSMVTTATSAWNDYIGDNIIRADTWYIIENVEIRDSTTDIYSEGAFGTTFQDIAANGDDRSCIIFFTDTMDDLAYDEQRQKVVMHELGHGLGLAHNKEESLLNGLGNIMQQGELPYSTYAGLDDIASVLAASENY